MDADIASKADIMERRLMGGGAPSLSVTADAAKNAAGEAGSSDESESFGYRRVFAPLSSNPGETTMIDFVALQNEGDDGRADVDDDQVRYSPLVLFLASL